MVMSSMIRSTARMWVALRRSVLNIPDVSTADNRAASSSGLAPHSTGSTANRCDSCKPKPWIRRNRGVHHVGNDYVTEAEQIVGHTRRIAPPPTGHAPNQ